MSEAIQQFDEELTHFLYSEKYRNAMLQLEPEVKSAGGEFDKNILGQPLCLGIITTDGWKIKIFTILLTDDSDVYEYIISTYHNNDKVLSLSDKFTADAKKDEKAGKSPEEQFNTIKKIFGQKLALAKHRYVTVAAKIDHKPPPVFVKFVETHFFTVVSELPNLKFGGGEDPKQILISKLFNKL
jgi:hypothetical protein